MHACTLNSSVFIPGSLGDGLIDLKKFGHGGEIYSILTIFSKMHLPLIFLYLNVGFW